MRISDKLYLTAIWARILVWNKPFLMSMIATKKAYWLITGRIKLYAFYLRRAWFGWRRNAKGAKESATILASIFRLIVGSFFVGSVIVGLLYSTDKAFTYYAQSIWPDLDGLSNRALGSLSELRLQKDALLQLYGTIAQISATFIGLYFASVSIVASTVYVSAPGDIRKEIVLDRIGNIYIRVIGIVGCISVIQLGLTALDVLPGFSNLAFTIVLSVVAILAFLPLAARLFYFYDPSILARDFIVRDIYRWISAASKGGEFWEDEAFQNYYYKEARARFETIRGIISLVLEKQSLHGSLVRLSSLLCEIQRFYSHKKNLIPPKSRWFGRVPEFGRWFLASDTQASVALQTGTSIDSTEVPIRDWVEYEIQQNIEKCMDEFLKRGDFENAYNIYAQYNYTLEYYCRQALVDEAVRLYGSMRTKIVSVANSVSDDQLKSNPTVGNSTLGFFDLYGHCYSSMVLEVNKSLSSLSVEHIQNAARQMEKGDAVNPFPFSGSQRALSRIEYIRDKLKIEIDLYKNPISPNWYLMNMIAIGVHYGVKDAVEAIVDQFSLAFTTVPEELIERKKYIVAAQFVQRALEGERKLSIMLLSGRKCEKRLQSLFRVSDLPSEKIDWEKLEKSVSDTRKKLLQVFAKLAPEVANLDKRKDLPDYFGHAYWLLSEECISAIFREDADAFSAIFPFYFTIALSVLDKYRNEWLHERGQSGLTYYSDIMIDLLSVSGLAFLMKEVDHDRYWLVVDRVWSAYLSAVNDEKLFINSFVFAINARESAFTLSPRHTARFRWEQGFRDWLSEKGIIPPEDDYSGRYSRRKITIKSPYIRAIGRHISMDKMHHMFVVGFLLVRPAAGGIQAGSSIEEIQRELKREKDRGDEISF